MSPVTPSRLASIDLGTNTVRLLVVEVDAAGRWHVVEQDQEITRLGEGLAASGRLGETPMARTGAVVARYVARARQAGAAEPRIIATSAVREATNGAEYATALERTTGAPVRVVSGEDEARLTVLAIVRGLGRERGPLLAFDIGGGSTEYVLAHDGRVQIAVSLRLGVVALAERYPFLGSVDWPCYHELEAAVRGRLLDELPPAIRRTGLGEIIGTAGTVTTLAALDLGLERYDSARVHGHRLSRAVIETLRDRLGALSVAERAALPCLEPGRADLIVPGLAIVLATLDATGAEAVVASDWGLREGIMAEAVEAPSHE
jgi:exopolyphosphatase / guanosine-5'-triphosphate,3'-diphosphate pyrophosphatase